MLTGTDYAKYKKKQIEENHQKNMGTLEREFLKSLNLTNSLNKITLQPKKIKNRKPRQPREPR